MSFWRSRRASIVAGILLVVGTVGFIGLLAWRNANERELYGYAFPDLQDARTEKEAKPILEKWKASKDATEAIRTTMKLDLVFPFFYAPLLALLAYRASLNRLPWVARLGPWFALAALVGGACDVGENTTMLTMMSDPNGLSLLFRKNVFFDIKYAGSIAAMVYGLLAHLDS